MKIYLDIVLLENFIMNYIIIFSTAIISRSKISNLKFFVASIFASLYSVINYIYNIRTFQNFFIKIIVSVIIVLIAFENYKIKMFLKKLILFYLVSFTFGGIAFMLLFLINPSNIIIKNGILTGTFRECGYRICLRLCFIRV